MAGAAPDRLPVPPASASRQPVPCNWRSRRLAPLQRYTPSPETMDDIRAPKVSFVSLGCPKALVDSERIITRLRAEGYELTREHAGADLVIVNTCGFLDSAQAESLAAIGEALAAERQGDRHRLHGRRAGEDHRSLSRPCSRSPARSNTRAWSRRCIARCRRARSVPRSGAAGGHQAHAAALRLSQDFRGL